MVHTCSTSAFDDLHVKPGGVRWIISTHKVSFAFITHPTLMAVIRQQNEELCDTRVCDRDIHITGRITCHIISWVCNKTFC